ncbi:hypothetical protein KP509_08G012200 [Ceratopteris richardii]|uniref:Phosphorylated adapter RNA export protein n=1 Tax=Ceratopteris richardii TaxID=49495 RepID=A0A8T2U7T2_CERRI|nr:hypothetical protein KP509_08G012200 [Ceratopteris richardii]
MESVESLWEYDDELLDFDDVQDEQTQVVDVHPAKQPQTLEDGEIEPADPLHEGFHTSTQGVSFKFMTNDLDAAVHNSKKSERPRKSTRKKGQKKKGSHQKATAKLDLKAFVANTCHFLREPKQYLVEAALQRLGIDVIHNLIQEVKTIEQNGGQMIADGGRRRTPGGVLWNVLRSRYAEDYKAIMAAGRDHELFVMQKQQKQQKRKIERDDMVIDGQPSIKRRRTVSVGSEMEREIASPVAQVKRTGVTVCSSKVVQMDDVISKVDPDNKYSIKCVQNAWAQGIRKGKSVYRDDDMNMDDAMIRKSSSVTERIRMPVQYDDL